MVTKYQRYKHRRYLGISMTHLWTSLGIVLQLATPVYCDHGGVPRWISAIQAHSGNAGIQARPGHVGGPLNNGLKPPGHAGASPHWTNSGHVPPGLAGGHPHWTSSGHIPPGHAGWLPHLINSGSSSQTHESGHPGYGHASQLGNEGNNSLSSNIEIPPALNAKRLDYEIWWKHFQSEVTGCGVQHAPSLSPLFRVAGGNIATVSSWPWMVSMYSTLIGQPWCAGTLVASQWVITAAHCFNGPFANPAFWTLHFGKNNASGFAEYPDEQVRTILGVTIHPDYNGFATRFAFDNDIAIVKLDKPVVFNDRTSPLCLVRSSDHVTDHVRAETKCSITGYGISSPTDVMREINILHEARVPLINKTSCSDMDGYADKFTGNMICAGFDTGFVDTCSGDSGGPLQCYVEKRWYLVGVTSWGGKNYEGCAEPNQPGAYTDVSKYTPWIYTHLFNDNKP